jgi:hypothetical protein
VDPGKEDFGKDAKPTMGQSEALGHAKPVMRLQALRLRENQLEL